MVTTQEIENAINNLEDDESTVEALKIYKRISDDTYVLAEKMDSLDVNERDSFVSAIRALKKVLKNLHGQALYCSELKLETQEDFMEFANWVAFWGGLFGDESLFMAAYPQDIMGEIYNFWQFAAEFADSLLKKEGWNMSFSELLRSFSSQVEKNNGKTEDLMKGFTHEKLNDIIYGYRDSVDMLVDLLTEATAALHEM